MRTPFNLFIILLVLSLLSSCRNLSYVYINEQMPAQVLLPLEIKTIGIVNRTLAENNRKKFINTVEGVLTGEGVFEDRNGSIACVEGAKAQFNNGDMVNALSIDTLKLEGTSAGIMPLPLGWETVQRISETNNVDALLVLEVFDTDQRGSNTTKAVSQIVAIGRSINNKQPLSTPSLNPSDAQVITKAGWRLYDAKNKRIIDEVRGGDYVYVGNPSILVDPGEFAKRDAIQQSAFISGRDYAARMLPSWRRAQRSYYRRRGDEMKIADRMIQTGDWNGATEIWKGLSDHYKRKKAGRACYNMALSNEANGDLESAVDWAQKAYSLYKEKRAPSYVNILRKKIHKEVILKDQEEFTAPRK